MELKDGSYISNERINDYANSSAFDWVIHLWTHADYARMIVIRGADFQTLVLHPDMLHGIAGDYIKVQNTGLFFPYLGLTLINADLIKSYQDTSFV